MDRNEIRVYVAGRINDAAIQHIQNLHRMTFMDVRLRNLGYSTFNPCLSMLTGVMSGGLEYEDYASVNMVWLEAADCVFLTPGWHGSKGTEAEIKRAKDLGIPVFDELDDLDRWSLEFKRDKYQQAYQRGRYAEKMVAKSLLWRLWMEYKDVLSMACENIPDYATRSFVVDDTQATKVLRQDLIDYGLDMVKP